MSKTKTELTATPEAAENKTEQNKPAVAEKKMVVYIGPSIKNVVSTGTVYNNGLPAKLTQETEKQPVIKSLLIPVDELAAAQKELATPGSALAVIYNRVVTN